MTDRSDKLTIQDTSDLKTDDIRTDPLNFIVGGNVNRRLSIIFDTQKMGRAMRKKQLFNLSYVVSELCKI